jgi:ABC-type molybdate transport system substrate-binding protein
MRATIICLCLLLLAGCPQPKPAPADAPATGQAPVVAGKPPAQAGAEITPVAESGPAIKVWADPVLRPALEALAPEFKKIYKGGYELEPVERDVLLERLNQPDSSGLPAVICADQVALAQFDAKGLLYSSTRRTFAGDRLVLAETPGTGYNSPTLFDIYQLRFKQFGLGEPGTLAGYYGEQALITEGGYDRIKDRIKRYSSTAALLDALKLDEAQVILIPASVAAVNHVSAWLLISEDVYEDLVYQAAACNGHESELGVPELLRFIAEDAGVQTQLEGYGLVGRDVALVEN